jgi:DNA invertase Pin-like site-specific DNA recombinase
VTVYGYSRVSTSEQAEKHGVDAQRATIDAEAIRRGWDVVHVVDAGWSGSNLQRPGITELLGKLRRDDVLLVARLDRLSRSLADFAGLMQEAQRRRWSFVALDLGVDTTTATGRLVASVMASVAEWERAVIGQRTKDALAAAKLKGILPGRRSAVPAAVQETLLDAHEHGMTMRQMAALLNRQGVLTVTGAHWTHSSVYGALRSAMMERDARLLLAATR